MVPFGLTFQTPREREFERKLQREAAARTLRAYYAQPDRFKGATREGMPPVEVMTAYKTWTGLPWPSRPVEGQRAILGQLYGPESEMAVNLPTEAPVPASAVRSPLEEETYGIEERGKATARGQVGGKKIVREWLSEDYPELSREDVMEKLGVGLPYKTQRGRTMAEAEEDYRFGLGHPTTQLGFAMKEEGYPATGSIYDITRSLAEAKEGKGDIENVARELKFWRTVQKAFTMSDMEVLATAIGQLTGTEYEGLKDKPPAEIGLIADRMIRQLTQKLIQETGYVPPPEPSAPGGSANPNDPQGIFQ